MKLQNWCLLLLLLVVSALKAQTKDHDSLLQILKSQEGLEKLKTLEQLYTSIRFKDMNKAKDYAIEALQLSESLNDDLGIATASYRMGSLMKRVNLDSALYHYDKAQKFAVKANNRELEGFIYGGMSDAKRLKGEYDKALELTNKSMDISRELHDWLNVSISLQNKSSIYRNKGNYTLAYQNSIAAQKIMDTISGQALRKADLLKDIGEIEYHRANYDDAITNYKNALSVYEAEEDFEFGAMTLNRIANSYIALKSFDNAKQFAEKAGKISKEKGMTNNYNISQINLGIVLNETGNYEQAKSIIEQTLKSFREEQNINAIYSTLLVLGQIYDNMKSYDQAEAYYNEGLLIADTINAPRESQEFYLYKSKLNFNRGQFKQAYLDQEQFIKLKDSLSEVNNERNIEELITIYETEKKEKELALQKTEIEVLRQQEVISKNRQRLLGIGSLLLVMFGGALIYGLRQKMKRNKVERETLDASLEFKEKELTTHALHLAHKNEILLDLKSQLKDLKSNSDNSKNYQKVINTINLDINNDQNWEQFRTYFEDVHKDFNSKVMRAYPEVSANDLRLMSLLKMNLSSKEIANILNISTEGVKKARYRLRKKLNLSTEDSLQELVIEL
ncbi:tetratricopeptide repeat protein [Psychroserpens algicola]|uniref:tetratricopeptide repeat protein n=1 Tax=Psychroserpens algicola TaxID=1719034 RepID=UPI0019540F68|nr:tetratricopeptide repeat protein [Psychroserpens algicola]